MVAPIHAIHGVGKLDLAIPYARSPPTELEGGAGEQCVAEVIDRICLRIIECGSVTISHTQGGLG